ncbi:MAG: hypothetical protein FJZ90_14665 [Chloroflexi bacterium]|nr:hypothetical protein [Chloroflexota bacterium]
MAQERPGRLWQASAAVLFTLQAWRALVAMLFGQVYDAVFDGQGMAALALAGVLVVLMLLAPLASPSDARTRSRRLGLWVALGALARVLVSVDVPMLRLAAAAATVGLCSLFVAGLLQRRAALLAPALSLGAFADQLLRALGHTFDPSLRPWWIAVQLALALALGYLYLRDRKREPAEEAVEDGAGFQAGLAYGALVFLLTSLLALPNAAARLSGGGYSLMVAGLLAITTLPLWPPLRQWYREGMLTGRLGSLLLAGALLLIGLGVAYQGRAGLSAAALLEAAVALWLILPMSLHSGHKGARGGMVAGLVALLLLSTAHAFAFTYPYTLRTFQGAGLPTLLVGALLVIAAALARQAPGAIALPTLPKPRLSAFVLVAAWLLGSGWSLPHSPKLAPDVERIRVATYNMHYGFDTFWHLSLEEQAHAIEESRADVVALQEVDAGRLTSYGVDHALWLGRRLGMEAIFLPAVEGLTGIALLSRVRPIETDGVLLPSQDEPTGIVRATIRVGGEPLAVHGIWLGLTPKERARQLEAALAFIGEGRAVLAGDMNAAPDSPVYAMMRDHGFTDPFALLGFDPAPTSPAVEPAERIDYVWLRGLEPTEARVSDSLASDHRLVVVEAR